VSRPRRRRAGYRPEPAGDAHAQNTPVVPADTTTDDDTQVINMVQPWQLALAIILGLAMLALILGMAFIPDNTKDWGV